MSVSSFLLRSRGSEPPGSNSPHLLFTYSRPQFSHFCAVSTHIYRNSHHHHIHCTFRRLSPCVGFLSPTLYSRSQISILTEEGGSRFSANREDKDIKKVGLLCYLFFDTPFGLPSWTEEGCEAVTFTLIFFSWLQLLKEKDYFVHVRKQKLKALRRNRTPSCKRRAVLRFSAYIQTELLLMFLRALLFYIEMSVFLSWRDLRGEGGNTTMGRGGTGVQCRGQSKAPHGQLKNSMNSAGGLFFVRV